LSSKSWEMLVKKQKDIRESLIDMLEDLDERLGKITADVRHAEQPLSKDFAEQATEMENNEVLDSLGNAARDEMIKVRQAIERIDNGQYGICVVCGDVIQKERLEALPFTDKCIKCAQAES